jgi:signal transduction histidine kinase
VKGGAQKTGGKAGADKEIQGKALGQTAVSREREELRERRERSERSKSAFQQAADEGFEIAPRNVVPQQPLLAATQDARSKTVSRSRAFAELLTESDGGLLPHLTDEGLELLFWARRGEIVAGCSLRMDMVRERIEAVLPQALSQVRLLTVLDDRGEPLAAPTLSPDPAPDWRRPFVAREISPLLPRWEVGIWLANPDVLTSRARLATFAVWSLVAALSLLILAGSAAVLRMLSLEMRIASQKTTFAANVTHELKTPLTSIRLFAELLLSGRQENEEKRREYLRTITSEIDRLTRLIDNVLALAKRRKGDEHEDESPLSVRRLDLADLARETAAQLEPQLAKNGFVVSLEGLEPLYAQGNREALRQVLMNLLSNAEKYSLERREVSLRCWEEKEGAGWTVVEVADRGIGVSPRFAKKIFSEFFRVDDSLAAANTGAGLGLAIARDIARRHGGDVTYEPRPGGGSRFFLRLPRCK